MFISRYEYNMAFYPIYLKTRSRLSTYSRSLLKMSGLEILLFRPLTSDDSRSSRKLNIVWCYANINILCNNSDVVRQYCNGYDSTGIYMDDWPWIEFIMNNLSMVTDEWLLMVIIENVFVAKGLITSVDMQKLSLCWKRFKWKSM